MPAKTKKADTEKTAETPTAAAPPTANAWRNRIVGTGEVDAKELLANPRNWRKHSAAQKEALAGVVDKVGWVQDVIINRTTGFIVDGHARVDMALARNERVPVVYVELTVEEEALVLASLDPISAMAGTDKDLLGRLVASMPAEGALAGCWATCGPSPAVLELKGLLPER